MCSQHGLESFSAAGEERWLEYAARAGNWKESKIIPVSRNAVVHWLKLPVRAQHRKIQEKTKVKQ